MPLILSIYLRNNCKNNPFLAINIIEVIDNKKY